MSAAMSSPQSQAWRGAGAGQLFPITPRRVAALASLAHPTVAPEEIRWAVRQVVDPDRTLLDAPTAGASLRSLLGVDHWDQCVRSVRSLQPPTLVEILGELLGRADGAAPLDQIRNLDSLNRHPATGRPVSVRALVDDLLGVAPAWPARDEGASHV